MARYSLFVLKVPLNPRHTNKHAVNECVGLFQQVPSLDLSENMTSELAYGSTDLNGTTVVHVPRTETRRNRSCRAAASVYSSSQSRSHSRHRNVRTRDPHHDLSAMADHCGAETKENFIVPCTPKTPRQRTRPTTVGASPPRSYQRTPSSPPACLTTTLPATSQCSDCLLSP